MTTPNNYSSRPERNCRSAVGHGLVLLACLTLLFMILAGCATSKEAEKDLAADETATTERPLTVQERLQRDQDEAKKFLDQVFDWYNGKDAESLAGHMSSRALAAHKRTVQDQQKIYEEEFEKDQISLVKKDYFQIENLEVWGLRTYYTYDAVDRDLAFVAFKEDGKWVYCNYEGFSTDYLN